MEVKMKITKNLGWRFKFAILLLLTSAVLYTIIYYIFEDTHTLFFHSGAYIAFIPIEVLLVVLVIEAAIGAREKKIMLEKLNMVIGAFFSEIGTDILAEISKFDSKSNEIRESLNISGAWTDQDFLNAKMLIKSQQHHLDINEDDPDYLKFLNEIKNFLMEKKSFILTLLENPNLMEHETFTDLLWAIFHLKEELEKRDDLNHLAKSDYQHLRFDIERVYNLLIYEWLEYMEHIMKKYPYLFSLAMRTNPFDQDVSVVIPD
ncbi:MAG: hypothetical protein LUQ70_03915 [Methanobacteriaceae archaeon]|nr:hypothetical protein [Methanobacteriaceae archaeon]